jgi:hypothetical protein
VPGVPAAAFRPAQTRPVLQVPLLPEPQQGFPEAPHSELAAQTPPLAESMHENPWSQVLPPPMPPPPGQHALPAPPHALQVPPPRAPASVPPVKQPSPAWQLLPPQQAAPSAPQSLQVPPPIPVALQPRPALQVLPEQQG